MKTIAGLSLLFVVGLPTSGRAEQLLIAFSSNLDSTGGCHRDDPTGADLYTVVLDLDKMKLRDLTRITNRPSQAEWFSSISPDGRLILFNHTCLFPRTQAVLAHDRQTGREHVLLRDARFPHWHSGTEFFYSNIRRRHDCHYARVAWNGHGWEHRSMSAATK